MKATFLQIKVDALLKKSFSAAVAKNDREMSQVVRDFMREYILKNSSQKK